MHLVHPLGAFDRSQQMPNGERYELLFRDLFRYIFIFLFVRLEQADATSWMAFYCMLCNLLFHVMISLLFVNVEKLFLLLIYAIGIIMLKISIELAIYVDSSYEDLASKFFEHFILIADAANNIMKQGLWYGIVCLFFFCCFSCRRRCF
jgi:hypothetical protein